MKKHLFAALCLVLLLCFAFSVSVFAETEPYEDDPYYTDGEYSDDDPYYSEPEDYTDFTDDPYIPDETTGDTVYDTEPTDYIEPDTTQAISTAPITEATSAPAHTNPPAPTEPDADSTYSDYVSPDPIYTPADQDFEEKDWEEIQLNLTADPAPGKQSFAAIQNNTASGNDSAIGFLIVGIVLVFLSLAGFTFVILFRPYKKAAVKQGAATRTSTPAIRSAYPSKAQKDNRRTYDPDDYNDGF